MAILQPDSPDSDATVGSADALRVCSACGATVARQDCHKNRYAEYICHQCRRDGISFTRLAQFRHFFRWSPGRAFLFLAVVGLVLLAAWALYKQLQ